ncbi:glycerophosphodiester phosphodiesterase family protein [Sphingobacterium paludis]|jgi:glycerophosphoryl diester phosphodiesterase|uniref:Glycerophosphoryl diester phosphodiesterase n=1 Tax=Sphingobacterium paludis TaxID=1476465 RepID=A0A4R7CZ90_9SPHI|nr:glycerophosphodiester phosphodiesterase family protein [Sphingobacterium paludis]TDS12494.1 glycerophosphoryl diester phosphodiesterase [Sphingobacterium paludis]
MRQQIKLLALCVILVVSAGCFRQERASNLANISNHNQVFNFSSIEDLYRFLTYSDKRLPMVSAHRGGPDVDYPENAIETFQRLAYKTPIIIECDIALSKDSVPILMHDQFLERTTTGSGKVNHQTLRELKDLRLKDPFGKITNYQIPTLEETLLWGVGKVIFTLDVKRDVPYRMVVDAIRKAKAEAYCIVITYSADQAATVNNLAPDLMISASIKSADDLLRLSDADVPDTRIVAFIGTAEAKKPLIDLLHQHGILCILGTMGNLDKQAEQRGKQMYAQYIENGADILSTDRPLDAASALNYYSAKRGLSSPYIN